MSAFVVDSEHIDALLTAALHYSRSHGGFRWYVGRGDEMKTHQLLSGDNEDAVGAMLIAENRRSVGYRYSTERELPGPIDTSKLDDYTYHHLIGYPDPLIVLKAVACYRYQSCETPDWEDSDAFAFCTALEHLAINQLPGYDDAPGWSIADRHVFNPQAPRRKSA
jgi:hypothetical protein